MYQFIHTESYGINASTRSKNTEKAGKNVSYVVNEAIRHESAIPHLKAKHIDPLPPIYLHGEPLEKLEATCQGWLDSMTDTKGRKLRKDSLTLLAGVVSAENTIAPDDWNSFKNDVIDWLKKKYGDQLKTVVEHIDEEHPHLHFYVVPEAGKRFETVHQGREAQALEKQKGGNLKAQKEAHNIAMREFQDEFNADCAAKHGMTRLGPKKRRLGRREWVLEQVQAEHAGKLMRHAETLVSTAKTDVVQIKQAAKKEAVQIKAKAAKSVEIAEQKGFAAGIEKAEKMPLIKKILTVFSKAARERDELKNEVKKLSKTASAFSSLKAKAREVFSDFKAAKSDLSEQKQEILELKKSVKDVERLEKENKTLRGELLSVSVDKYQDFYESAEIAKNLENKHENYEIRGSGAINSAGSTSDAQLSESRGRAKRHEAEAKNLGM